MSTRLFSFLACALALWAGRPGAMAAPAPVAEVGFEEGTPALGTFVPPESEGMRCAFSVVPDEPHSGKACGRLHSEAFARFCAAPRPFIVHAGTRYRVSVWVRSAAGTGIQPRQQGFLVRLMPMAGGQQLQEGALHILPDGRVSRNFVPAREAEGAGTLPTEWTKIEAVVEVAQGTESYSPNLFAWYAMGDLFIDDFRVEEVGADVPATPVIDKGQA